ncbi:MAG: hypothetical protein U0003_03645 [Vampirovibrionales bacterium]
MDATQQGALIRILVVPVLAGLFSVLPVRVGKNELITLAQWLWLLGGVALLMTGIGRLQDGMHSASLPMVATLTGLFLIIGIAKGRFVLGKTARRNLNRLQALEGPQPLVQVYETRSWILIMVMLVLSASLTWLNAPMLWRGLINLAVGLALILSSRFYHTAPNTAPSATPIAPSA